MQDGHFFPSGMVFFSLPAKSAPIHYYREFKNLRFSRKPFHHWHTISFWKACALGRGLIQDPSALFRRAELASPLLFLRVEVKLVWYGCSLAHTPPHPSSAFQVHFANCHLFLLPTLFVLSHWPRELTPAAALSRQGSPGAKAGRFEPFGGSLTRMLKSPWQHCPPGKENSSLPHSVLPNGRSGKLLQRQVLLWQSSARALRFGPRQVSPTWAWGRWHDCHSALPKALASGTPGQINSATW